MPPLVTGHQLSENNLGRTSSTRDGNFFYGSSLRRHGQWPSHVSRRKYPTFSSLHKLTEWSVPVKSPGICSLVANGKRFFTCFTPNSLSFWHSTPFTQVSSTLEIKDQIRSVALSSDDSFLACGRDGGITVYALRDILPGEVLLDVSTRPYSIIPLDVSPVLRSLPLASRS